MCRSRDTSNLVDGGSPRDELRSDFFGACTRSLGARNAFEDYDAKSLAGFKHAGEQKKYARIALVPFFSLLHADRVSFLFEVLPEHALRVLKSVSFELPVEIFTQNVISVIESNGGSVDKTVRDFKHRLDAKGLAAQDRANDPKKEASTWLSSAQDFAQKRARGSFAHQGAESAAARELIVPYVGLTREGRRAFVKMIGGDRAVEALSSLIEKSLANDLFAFQLILAAKSGMTGPLTVDLALEAIQKRQQEILADKRTETFAWSDWARSEN